MSLIANYGLFWRRDWVYWGRQKSKGHLKGILASGKKLAPVDFRNQRGIYALYDDQYEPVYIGQAGKKNRYLLPRLRDHTSDHLADRWSRFSWFGIRAVEKNDAGIRVLSKEMRTIAPTHLDILDHFEAVLIHTAEPRLNRRGGNFGAKTEQYLQHRDQNDLGLTQEEQIRAIYEGNKNV